MAGTQSNSWESRRLEIPFSSLLPTLMQQRAEGKSSLTHWEAVDGSRGSVQDTFIRKFIIGLLWVIMVYPPDFDSLCERFFHRQVVHRPSAVYLTVSLWNDAVEVRNLEDIHGISMNYVDASNVKLSILQRIWEMEAGHLIALKAFQPLVVNSFYILLTSSCSFFPPRETGRRCGALYRWCSLANGWFQKQLLEQISAETSIIHGLVSEQRHMSFGDWKASAHQTLRPCTFLSKASKEVFPGTWLLWPGARLEEDKVRPLLKLLQLKVYADGSGSDDIGLQKRQRLVGKSMFAHHVCIYIYIS
jgi:hypothetical protein